MKRFKTQWMAYCFLAAVTVFACWFFVGRCGVFGAKVDWISQHSVIPDYFRQQFYETGNLFPEFAANLGGGQNIYNFAYYGLYSPIILISYLLPFVEMEDYLMAASVAGLAFSACLMYAWLGKRGFSSGIRMAVSVMFLLAGPMIYQSYHQVMFVNYMPFLLLAFLGVERHFERRKSGLYTIGVFLMIMTSFYFSIGGMLALTLYGVSRYLELGNRGIGRFFREGLRFLFPMITAVCMSGVLLVPTAYAILGKREGTKVTDILSLLLPDVKILRLTYSGYGIGLTVLIITVLIAGLTYRKWHERVLAYGCVLIVTIPVFSWLLNGGLYVRDKALIPFLPLFCYLMAVYLQKQKDREIPFRVSITAYILTLALLCYGYFTGQGSGAESSYWTWLFADGVLMLICFLLFRKSRRLTLLYLPPVLCLCLFGSAFHRTAGEITDRDTYAQITDAEIGETISRILDEEDGCYRVEQGGTESEKAADLNRIWDNRQWISSIYSSSYNADYQEFRKEIFGLEEPFRNDLMQAASDNPLFQKLMGVKYVVNNTENGTEVEINENVAPVAYATDKVISAADYESLSFPYNQTALMKYAVVQNSRRGGEDWKNEVTDTASRAELSLPETDTKDLALTAVAEGKYHVQAEKKTSVICQVTAPEGQEGSDAPVETGNQEDQILYLQFRVKNQKPGQDVAVWAGGIRNKLTADSHFYYNGNTTFTYVIRLQAGQTEVELTFGAGEYELSELECYLGSTDVLEDGADGEKLYQSVFQPDWDKTKDNRIVGTIQVEQTGYFITSIPYDAGFEILVDGTRTASEKVNEAFLGCSLSEGNHRIEIIYHAPGVKAGKALSCFGILLLVLGTCWARRKPLPWNMSCR